MARTYKTAPAWVKINRPKSSREVYEVHDHRTSDCDIDEAVGTNPFYWQRRGSCGYSISYYGYHGGFFSRPSSKTYRREHEGRMRAEWRKARQDMLKLSFEDIKDYDVKTYQHRHSALWEMY